MKDSIINNTKKGEKEDIKKRAEEKNQQQLTPSSSNKLPASPEIPHILWNPKVQYRIHSISPYVLDPSHINPIHAPHPTFW